MCADHVFRVSFVIGMVGLLGMLAAAFYKLLNF